jgi:hypothetical protein
MEGIIVIAAGTECYNVNCDPVVAGGFTYDDEELATALNGPVSQLIRDDKGRQDIEDLLLTVVDTEFKADALEEMLIEERVPEDWRVGEAVAEAYLTDHRRCIFPWPTGRDQKDPNASMPGTDLVGFQETEHEQLPIRFAFGEVKTSGDGNYPPSVMYGRHGLKQQLEDLRDSKATRRALVLYLGHHAMNAPWGSEYRTATSRYLANAADVSLFGVMIRDVNPDERDLRARAQGLANGCPTTTSIELIAIYLPSDSIDGIGHRVHLARGGENACN